MSCGFLKRTTTQRIEFKNDAEYEDEEIELFEKYYNDIKIINTCTGNLKFISKNCEVFIGKVVNSLSIKNQEQNKRIAFMCNFEDIEETLKEVKDMNDLNEIDEIDEIIMAISVYKMGLMLVKSHY